MPALAARPRAGAGSGARARSAGRYDRRMPRRRPSTPRSTRDAFPRIAFAFDFDDTLAPDSMGSLLASYGVDKEQYWDVHVRPKVDDGWDPIPAAFHALIEFSRSRTDPAERLTRRRLADHGRSLKPFPGVEPCLNRLRRVAGRVAGIEVEFYIISSGIGEIIRAAPLARLFRNVWASEFHYDRTGEIAYPRKVISHTEKTRYLQNISKGVDGPHGYDRPLDLDPTRTEADVRVPLRHIVYVGDGQTDIPCFSLINQEKGFAFGVFKDGTARKWGEHANLTHGRRLSNLVPADFSARSELAQSLVLATESLCKQIQVRRLSGDK